MSEILNINKANTARALKKLEDEGYVYRAEDPADARKKIVYITEKSRDFEQEFHEVFKGLNRILAKDFTDDERETARRLLYKMFDNIAEYERSHR